MEGKNASAQALTIRLLQKLLPAQRKGVYDQAATRLNGDIQAQEHLRLCFGMAGELNEDPDKYKNNFTTLAKTIIARQVGKAPEKVTKKSIWETANRDRNGQAGSAASATNFVDRVHDGVRELKPEEIISLCGGFKKESSCLFWKNQILLLFPDLPEPDVKDGPVLNCLQAVWDSLSEEERETAQDTILSHWDWFAKLSSKESEPFKEYTGLYALLDKASKNARISQERICEELNMDQDTYRSYRRAWEKFEENGCKGPYPRNRLSRERLLYLAVFLDMDYYTTVGMLGMAGYAFQLREADETVAGYLLERKYSKRDAMGKLHPREK